MATTVVNCRKESYDVYIGRGSKWGNPFKIGVDGDRDQVIDKYGEYVMSRPNLVYDLRELVGKKLGCYCHPKRCHGDILSKLADEIYGA